MTRPTVRRTAALTVLAAGLCVTPAASADVPLQVPTRFLGGPIWPALQVPVPTAAPGAPAVGRPTRAPARSVAVAVAGPAAGIELPAAVVSEDPDAAPDDDGIPGIDEPGRGDGPDDGVPLDRKLAVPTGPEYDGGDDAPDPEPDAAAPAAPPAPAPVPVAPPDEATLAPAHGGLIAPAAGGWLMWQTPTMRWSAVPGARYYNVQVFRGARRVLNAWPAGNRLSVPRGVLRQGRTYVWVVWPGIGRRSDATYGPALGRSTFAVTLRPRVVFRTRGRGGVVGEVRPHIPFGTLRLERPRAVAARVPAQVTLTRRGRFLLPIRAAQAERLGATLRDRGPVPPIGLRG